MTHEKYLAYLEVSRKFADLLDTYADKELELSQCPGCKGIHDENYHILYAVDILRDIAGQWRTRALKMQMNHAPELRK